MMKGETVAARRIRVGWRAAALLTATTLLPACGSDTQTYSYNCCTPDQHLYYVFSDRASYGKCYSNPSTITSLCVLQPSTACPPGSNQ